MTTTSTFDKLTTPAEINAEFKRRYDKQLAKHKGAHALPLLEDLALSDEAKRAFNRLISERDNKPRDREPGWSKSVKRKGWKRESVTAWADVNLGATFRPEDLAVELDISAGPVYDWISLNRTRLLKTGRGEYQVVDRTNETS